jgi:hypothetical protein
MAELGPEASRSGDIAACLGVKVNSIGPVRAKLIKKGMIYSPAYGDIAFTVPLFDESRTPCRLGGTKQVKMRRVCRLATIPPAHLNAHPQTPKLFRTRS